jgi:hypothetical protein
LELVSKAITPFSVEPALGEFEGLESSENIAVDDG